MADLRLQVVRVKQGRTPNGGGYAGSMNHAGLFRYLTTAVTVATGRPISVKGTGRYFRQATFIVRPSCDCANWLANDVAEPRQPQAVRHVFTHGVHGSTLVVPFTEQYPAAVQHSSCRSRRCSSTWPAARMMWFESCITWLPLSLVAVVGTGWSMFCQAWRLPIRPFGRPALGGDAHAGSAGANTVLDPHLRDGCR